MPISLREPAYTLKEVKMANNFIAVPVRIPIRKTLDESLGLLKPVFSSLKNSLSPFGCKMAFQLVASLPYLLPRYVLLFLTTKYHMFFTNLRAFNQPYVWNRKKQTGSFYYCMGICNINCGMSFLSVGDLMSMSCYADEYGIDKP